MNTFLASNNAQTTLAGSITSTATTAALAPGSGALLPVPAAGQQFALTFVDAATGLVNEIVYVTGMSGDNITSMLRAQEGTSGKAWLANDEALNLYTAGQDAAKAQIGPVQTNAYSYSVDTGTANTYVIALTPAVTALTDGMLFWFKAKTANTGASTLAVNGIASVPLIGAAQVALQGGEIIANGRCFAIYSATLASAVLIECTGGAQQVAPATQSSHAVQFGQLTGVVGASQNLKMDIGTASASATLTADQIVVATALNGVQYLLANFNKTINLATVGAGGMDTGTAPVSGFVALYAIYNPTTATANLLATNAATLQGNVYGGAHMPAGYTSSALISVYPTNASGQFIVGDQRDRKITMVSAIALSGGSNFGPAAFSIAGNVPMNAKTVTGGINITSSAVSSLTAVIGSNSTPIGAQSITGTSGTIANASFYDVDLITPQSVYLTIAASGGTVSITMVICKYTF